MDGGLSRRRRSGGRRSLAVAFCPQLAGGGAQPATVLARAAFAPPARIREGRPHTSSGDPPVSPHRRGVVAPAGIGRPAARSAHLLRLIAFRGPLVTMRGEDGALAPYTSGTQAIVEGSAVVTVQTTPAAASQMVAWSRTQARKAGHESAHCVVAACLEPPFGPIVTTEVSIKGRWSGVTRLATGEDTEELFESADRKRGRMVVLAAGLEGERALFGHGTDGSAADYESMAEEAVAILSAGLHPEASLVPLAPFGYGIEAPEWLRDERYRLVDKEMRWAREEARRIVAERREAILAFARVLFERRRLVEGEQIDALLASLGLPVPERKP